MWKYFIECGGWEKVQNILLLLDKITISLGYIITADTYCGLLSPRIGISDGWVRAKVTDIAGDIVEVEYPHRYRFVDNEGTHPDTEQSLKEKVPKWQIRSTPCIPLLSVFVVRWGGIGCVEAAECSDIDAGFWGSAGTSVCDNYINVFTDMFEKCLETKFEVITAFVQSVSDLEALAQAAPYITASLKGKHKAAMYFLWPTAFQDGSCGVAGMVQESALFHTMQRFELTGLSTRFPHPSHLYRCLVSKQWTAHLCLSEQYHIPATTRVSISAVRGGDRVRCAKTALESLCAIKRDSSVDIQSMKGVVKLGYSWEASDVMAFEGVHQLAERLDVLSSQPGCLADVVYVQDFVPSRCEVRVYLVNSVICHRRYTKPGKMNAETGRFEGFQDLTRDEAVSNWFDNDESLLSNAEKTMDELVQRWLLWLKCECAETQPVIRFDFFVGLRDSPDGGVCSCVHTGEITELGGSTLNWAKGPELIQRAVIAACLEEDVVSADSALVTDHYKFTPRHVRFTDASSSSSDDDDDDSDSSEENEDQHKQKTLTISAKQDRKRQRTGEGN